MEGKSIRGINVALRYLLLAAHVLIFCITVMYFGLSQRLIIGLLTNKGGILRTFDYVTLAINCVLMMIGVVALEKRYIKCNTLGDMLKYFMMTTGWQAVLMGLIMIPCSVAGSAPKFGSSVCIVVGVLLLAGWICWRKYYKKAVNEG